MTEIFVHKVRVPVPESQICGSPTKFEFLYRKIKFVVCPQSACTLPESQICRSPTKLESLYREIFCERSASSSTGILSVQSHIPCFELGGMNARHFE